MPSYAYQLFLDRFAPDGTVRTQDEFIASNGGLYEFYGAKWLDHDTHAVIGSDATNRLFGLYRKPDIASNPVALDSFTIGTQIMRGIAKVMTPEGRQEIWFVDTTPSPDDVYRIRLDSSSAPYAQQIGTVDTEPTGALCFADHDWIAASPVSAANNLLSRYRWDGSVLRVMGGVTTRSPFTNQYIKGCAWSGRDVACVSNNNTTPPTSYRLDLYRPVVSVTAARTLASRGSFGNEFAGAVDVDWNGREWLVYYMLKVDESA